MPSLTGSESSPIVTEEIHVLRPLQLDARSVEYHE